jgi:putative phosphotransacetylase
MKKISLERLELIIAETIAEFDRTPYVPILVSNRHIHLSAEDLAALFGPGYKLNHIRELLPGQFACEETLTITGRSGSLKNVRVLAPVRSETQVEISLTDNFTLGVSAPVNESGNLSGAAHITLENPRNSAKVERSCAIAAKRHIHLTPAFAKKHGLKNGQVVSVEADSPRGTVFKDVLVRISKDFRDEMHIDTDEANAGMIRNGDLGLIILDKETPSSGEGGARRHFDGSVLTRADILNRAGCREIVVGPGCSVTALAADTARSMNITIRKSTWSLRKEWS